MAILNQFSYVLIVTVMGLIFALGLWRWGQVPALLRIALLGLYVVAAVLFGSSRQYPAPEVRTLEDAEAILTNDQPTLVMLYSNY
ncbi:MAG: hypothetical protein Kow0077_27660 [Anaerolineae bacterium]